MQTARVAKLLEYPLKGAKGASRQELRFNSLGALQDRLMALELTENLPEGWRSKYELLDCATEPKMALLPPPLVHDGDVAQEYLAMAAKTLGREKLRLLTAPHGQKFTDMKQGFLSILNLCSVRKFSKHIGRPIDPQIFRANVWVDDMPAFDELKWVNGLPGNGIVLLGNYRSVAEFEIDRCKAIGASYKDGSYDPSVQRSLGAMMKGVGYAGHRKSKVHIVMGVYLRPLEEGVLRVGDTINALCV